MPSRWSSPGASVAPAPGRAGVALALILGLGMAWPLVGATVLDRRVDVEIGGDGSLDEKTHLEVRLETGEDGERWSRYPIVLDENRTLKALAAWVRRPDGSRRELGGKDFDTADLGDRWEIHTSAKVRVARFSEVRPGAVLGLDYEVIERPYFPAGRVRLTADDAVEHLAVHLHGPATAGSGWRWRVEGPAEGLGIESAGKTGEVTVTASGRPRPPLVEHAPDSVREATLVFAWGEAASWTAVGRWFEGLARAVPRGDPAVRQAARQRLASLPEIADQRAARRARLDALLGLLQKDVRYVAVEVGIGGFRPRPPAETLARRWGDCKAKAFLLLDLLQEAGIEAYPALVYSGDDQPIDPAFPSPFGFNHMIVALPAAGLVPPTADPAGDATSAGYLFVDPTQDAGASHWLDGSTQEQPALVVRGGDSALVRTPVLPAAEVHRLSLQLAAQPDGGAAGGLRIELAGRAARSLARLAGRSPAEAEVEVRSALGSVLPAARLASPRSDSGPGPVPTMTLAAGVTLSSFVASGEDGARSLSIHGLVLTPATAVLDGRRLSLVLAPKIGELSLQVTLPAGWCKPQQDDFAVANAVGSFRQSVACDGQLLTLTRRTVLARRFVPPELLPQLAELAAAEHRASARRLRLEHLVAGTAKTSPPAPR